MTPHEPNRWLKLKTKMLIKACGGLAEASAACEAACRPYSVPHLSRCQRAETFDFLPVDIVACLEEYCGRRIVSDALVAARPDGVEAGCIRDEVSDWGERHGDLSKAVRQALSGDDEIDASEAVQIRAIIDQGRTDMDQIEAALEARMTLRRVAAGSRAAG